MRGATLVGFRMCNRILLCATLLFLSLNMGLAVAIDFAPITQAHVENDGCENSENDMPLIMSASNDPTEGQVNVIVKTTIEFKPVDGGLEFQRYTKYSNANGEGTFTGKVMDVPLKYANAGKVMTSVQFGSPGTYQHIIVLRAEKCESRVTLPIINIR